MNPRLILILVPLALSACVFHSVPGRSYGSGGGALTNSPPQCKPSQHWDGEMCRHNGKGSGARKHDG